MKKKIKCVSCVKDIANDVGSTSFMCPSCNEAEIIRCADCRKTGAKYKCPKCGFEGPN